jgi:hypothetical protein
MASQQEQIGSRIKPHVTVPRSLLRSTMHAMHMASQRKHMKLAPLRLQQTTLRPGLCCTQPLLSRTSRRVFWAADDADGHHGPSPQKIRRFHGMDTQFGSIWGDFWAVDIPGKKTQKKTAACSWCSGSVFLDDQLGGVLVADKRRMMVSLKII